MSHSVNHVKKRTQYHSKFTRQQRQPDLLEPRRGRLRPRFPLSDYVEPKLALR